MPGDTFDVAIGLRRDVMDRAVAKLYGQLYPKYFKGDQDAGSGRRIYYDVKSAPKFDFTGTPNVAAKLLEELEKLAPPDASAKKSLLQAPPPSLEAVGAALDARTVKVRFDSIDIIIKSSKGEAKTTAAAVVSLAYEVEYPTGQPPRAGFKVTDAKATTPNPDDQYILNAVVIPVMKKLAAQVMSAIQIPSLITVAGFTFDLPEPRVIGDYYVILVKTMDRHFPLGLDVPVPGGNPEAFMLLSPEVMWKIFRAGTSTMKYEYRKNGTYGTDILNIYYDAIVSAGDIKGQAQGAQFAITASASGSAHVWAYPLGIETQVWFSVTPTSTPSGRVGLQLEPNNRIRAYFSSIDPFKLKVSVSGGGAIGWLLSMFEDIIEAQVNSFVPLIQNYLRTQSFDVWTIPDLPLSYEGITFNIRPTNLQLSSSGNHLQITGRVQL